MATGADIMTEARSVIAAMSSSRLAGSLFKPHTNGWPFSQKPASASDAFHVVAAGQRTTEAFGSVGTKEDELMLQVLLGHAPLAKETDRENYVARDVERIRDVLEMRTWTASVEACFFEDVSTDRSDPNWWITTLTFRVRYSGSIATQ